MDEVTAEFNSTIEPLLGRPLEPGDAGSVGPYRLISKIGAGGMGLVYRGRKVGDKIDLAIKILAPALMTSVKARQRFLREAALAADLRHDRLTGLIDLGEEDRLPYFVMPLLRGETLEQRLKREPISSLELTLRVARDALEGLAFAGAKGVIHRDIKPSNLWLEFDGRPPSSDSAIRVKILDLGLARRQTDDERVTSAGVMLGTAEYMAPEQVRGEDGDARSDLFSLGCVLYRMTTGMPPFRGANLMAVLRSLAMVEAKPPRQLNPAISRGLSDFIMTLIAKEPADRLASAADALRRLDRVDEFRSVVQKKAPPAKAPRKSPHVRSRRLVFASIAASAIAGCLAGVLIVSRFWQTPVVENTAPPPVVNDGPIKSFEARINNYLKNGQAERMALIDEILKYLSSQRPGPNRAAGNMTVSLVAEMDKGIDRQGNRADETSKRCDDLAAALSKSDDVETVDTGRWIAGVGRRWRLVGKEIDLAGHMLDGAELDWSAYRGKTVLVHFWRASSPECAAKMPDLKRIDSAYKDKGFAIVGINSDQTAESARKAVREWGLPWPNIREDIETRQPLYERYGILSDAEFFLIGPNGNVITTRGRRMDMVAELAIRFSDVKVVAERLAAAPDRLTKARIIAKAAAVEGLLEKLSDPTSSDGFSQAELARQFSAMENEALAEAARVKAREAFEANQAKDPENATWASALSLLNAEELAANQPLNPAVAESLAQLLLDRNEREDPIPWTVLQATEMISKGGATLSNLPDNSILASGNNPPGDNYKIVAAAKTTHLSALRLEALTHPTLPNQGPGRDEKKDPGNFAITTFTITATDPGAPPHFLEMDRVAADYSNGPVTADHWNTGGRGSRQHTAVYQVKPAIPSQDDTRVEFRMQFSKNADYPGQNLGRFRFSISSDPSAFDREVKIITATRIADPWAKLAAVYHIVDDQKSLESFLKRRPLAESGIGDLFAADQDWMRAISAYRRALSGHPAISSATAKLFTLELNGKLAKAYESAGMPRDAAQYLAAMSAVDPVETFRSAKVAGLQGWFGQDRQLAETRLRIIAFAKVSGDMHVAERAARALSSRSSTDKGELDAALVLARRAVELGKGGEWNYLALGMAEYRSGNLAASDKALLAAEQAKPNDTIRATSGLYRAMILFRQGKQDAARNLATTAAKIKTIPKSDKGLLVGGTAHDDLNLWLAMKEANAMIQFEPEALQPPQEVLSGDPLKDIAKTMAVEHAAFGAQLRQWSRLNEAVNHCRIAIELDPTNPIAHNNLGVSFQGMGKLDDALASYLKAIEIQPKNGIFRLNLGTVLQGKGLIDEAIENYRKANDLLPKVNSSQRADNLALLGAALLERKKWAEAEPFLRDCLAIREKLQPNVWTTFNTQSHLGVALLGQEKYADAEPLLLRGYEGMKQREKTIPPAGKFRLPEAVSRIVEVYEAFGQEDDAAKWRKELELHAGKLIGPVHDVGAGLEFAGQLNAKTASLAYQVKFAKGKTYAIEMASPDPNVLDSYLILRDVAGRQLAEDDDSGGNNNARIIFRADREGIFRIQATSYNAGRGPFTVTVREQAE